ncbi:MAG TPA: TolC family protein, partial [Gemmatimonadaceae bacterium]|nr:TolC family protein [Gemmatimonadaceae bacterium]
MRKLIAATVLVLTSACHFAPPHLQPSLPTPPVYLSASDSDATVGTRAADITWREFFRDPRLQALITTAMRSNRDLVIAVEQIEVARGQYRIQSADRFPAPVATAGASRSGAGDAATGIARAGTITTDRLSVGVGVPSFELDFWGRVRDLSEAARARYLATVQ